MEELKKKKVRTVVSVDIAITTYSPPANAVTVRGRADRFTFCAVAV